MPLSSTARGGEAHGSAGLVTHMGRRQRDRTSGRSSWGRFLRSEHTASCRTWPTHSALAWVPMWSSLGCLPLPGSWRQGEARTWGAQAQADMLGPSTHVPGAQKRVHGPLGARAPEACCFPAGLRLSLPCAPGPGPLRLLHLHGQASFHQKPTSHSKARELFTALRPGLALSRPHG